MHKDTPGVIYAQVRSKKKRHSKKLKMVRPARRHVK